MRDETIAIPNDRGELGYMVLDQLRERIIHWQYPPGHRLVEEELCREFGVSRSPVREALRMLVASGLIEQMPRRGYKVRQLDLQGVEELYELRLALELFVAERLAHRGLPARVLQDLRRIWGPGNQQPERSNEELAALDRTFHETLAAEAGNETLLAELRRINDRISIFRVLDFAIEGRDADTGMQHLDILDRIEAGDPESARTAMQINVQNGCANVERVIKDALATAVFGPGRGVGSSAPPRRMPRAD